MKYGVVLGCVRLVFDTRWRVLECGVLCGIVIELSIHYVHRMVSVLIVCLYSLTEYWQPWNWQCISGYMLCNHSYTYTISCYNGLCAWLLRKCSNHTTPRRFCQWWSSVHITSPMWYNGCLLSPKTLLLYWSCLPVSMFVRLNVYCIAYICKFKRGEQYGSLQII